MTYTVDDFPPVPSVEGAFYSPTPDGMPIVYTHERDAIIAGDASRNPLRKLRSALAHWGAKQRRWG